MILELTEDPDKISSILNNPKLYEAVHGRPFKDTTLRNIDNSYVYHLIINDGVLLGCFQTRELTKLVREVHIWLLPEYWGSGISLEIAKCGNTWLRENAYTQAWTRVPANAVHIIHYLNKIGYTPCGMIEKAMVFHNYLVSVFFYVLDLNNTKI